MKQIDWDDYRVFAAVARAGSFTRAAKDLRLTEPTVSRRIKRLETAIGSKLFDRGNGTPKLTYEGKRVLNYASAAEHSLVRATTLMGDVASEVQGECKLVVGEGLGSYWLPQFLVPFLSRNPNIDLVVFTTQDRASGRRPSCDLEIQYLEPLAEDTVAVCLGALHFTLFAAREYVIEYGMPSGLEDLGRHQLIDLTYDMTEKSTLFAWGGISARAALFTNSNGILGETVCAGGGISLLPTYSVLMKQHLVPVLPRYNRRAPLYLCYSREAAKRPAVRLAINFLKDFVFDRQRMPWFFEDYVAPHKDWKRQLDACISRATVDELQLPAAPVSS